ncbi:MAG: inositol monophosphatase family protein [Methanocellales archaeon]
MNIEKSIIEIAQEVRDRVRDYVKVDKTFGEEIARRGSDVTRKMDLYAEKALDEALMARDIRARIISEELGERIVPQDKKPECTLVFDPVDGSTNALLGIPYYCVSLAYSPKVKDVSFHDIEIGVVCDASGKTYSAVKGKGAALNGNKLFPKKYQKHKLVMAIYTYGASKIPMGVIELEKKVIVRIFGAIALDLCLLAEGKLDAVIESRNLISAHDVLAAWLILKEVGGRITDLNGNELDLEVTARGFSLIATIDEATRSEIFEKLKLKGFV